MQVAHVIISGTVQGVGFRQFIKHFADRLRIRGWVRNTREGTVEAAFSGEKEQIEKLIEICKKGPMLSRVENIAVDWKETTENFSNFEITY